MILYNKDIHLLTENRRNIMFSMSGNETVFQVDLDNKNNTISIIGDYSAEDQILMEINLTNSIVIVYLKGGKILVNNIPPFPKEVFRPSEHTYKMNIESFSENLLIKQTAETTISLFDQLGNYIFSIHDTVSYESQTYVIPVDLEISSLESRFLIAGRFYYDCHYNFVLYDLFRKEIVTKKVEFQAESIVDQLKVDIVNPETIRISNEDEFIELNYKRITARGKKIFDFYQLAPHRGEHLLGIVQINNNRYYIHNKTSGTFFTKGNILKVTGFNARMRTIIFGNNLYIYGRNTHYAYKASELYDYLYLEDEGVPISRFIRPLRIRFFKRYGFFKISLASLISDLEERKLLFIGNKEIPIHPLKIREPKNKVKILNVKRNENLVSTVNVSGRGNIFVLNSAEVEEYKRVKLISKWFTDLKKSKKVIKSYRALFNFIGKLPKKRNLVMFESFHAKQYSDSPRAIYEYMKENYPDYKLLWSIEKQSENLFEEMRIPYVRRLSLRWFLTFPRAKYWINNTRLPAWISKPRETVYVQTWHGTPLKKLGVDIEEIHMPGTKTSTYKRNFVNESAKWDYLVSPNSYSSEIFKRAFHYSGEVIESGYPRNDILSNYSKDLINNLKNSLNIPEEKKIMLYAPTWRDDEYHEKGKYKFQFQFDLNEWKKKFGSEWVLLTRMHYLVAENFDFANHAGSVFDVSSYPDIRDLYLLSDLMITDYSSVFFDYAILKRPVIFFMYDLEKYKDQLRGFYIDIEQDAPGPIVQTETDLFEAITQLAHTDVLENPKFVTFVEKFSSWEDGHATERVVQAFIKE